MKDGGGGQGRLAMTGGAGRWPSSDYGAFGWSRGGVRGGCVFRC